MIRALSICLILVGSSFITPTVTGQFLPPGNNEGMSPPTKKTFPPKFSRRPVFNWSNASPPSTNSVSISGNYFDQEPIQYVHYNPDQWAWVKVKIDYGQLQDYYYSKLNAIKVQVNGGAGHKATVTGAGFDGGFSSGAQATDSNSGYYKRVFKVLPPYTGYGNVSWDIYGKSGGFLSVSGANVTATLACALSLQSNVHNTLKLTAGTSIDTSQGVASNASITLPIPSSGGSSITIPLPALPSGSIRSVSPSGNIGNQTGSKRTDILDVQSIAAAHGSVRVNAVGFNSHAAVVGISGAQVAYIYTLTAH